MKLLIAGSIFIYFLTLIFLYKNSINLISNEVIIFYATLDALLTWLCCFLLMKSRSKSVYRLKDIAASYEKNFRKLVVVSIPAVLYLINEAVESASFAFGGAAASREQLIHEFDRNGFFYIISSSYAVLLASFLFSFKTHIIYKFYALIALLASMLVLLSRSELSNFLFMLVTFVCLRGLSFKSAIKFSIILLLILLMAATFTLMAQRRPMEDGISGIFNIIEIFIQYRAYSFHLSEIVLFMDTSAEKLLYPFFGYLSEKPLGDLFGIENVVDGRFLANFHYFGISGTGVPVRANSLYPWWPWFISSYSGFGFIIKFLFVYSVLNLALRLRLYFTFAVFLNAVLVTAMGRHPLLHLSAVSSVILIPLVFDFLVRIRIGSTGKVPKSAIIRLS